MKANKDVKVAIKTIPKKKIESMDLVL
jgi:calcium-dependent protein kinase